MTTYYVGKGGSDVADGQSWANRKLTLNGAEDIPVAANDTVYVGPGIYRESLTLDVSGSSGQPITYIGDVTGENTDGVGGIVRVTGSDNDTSDEARSTCIAGGSRDYRTFKGFTFDNATRNVYFTAAGDNIIIEDCVVTHSQTACIQFVGGNAFELRRSFILKGEVICSGTAGSRGAIIENNLFMNNIIYGVIVWGDNTADVKSNTFIFPSRSVEVGGAIQFDGMTAGTAYLRDNVIICSKNGMTDNGGTDPTITHNAYCNVATDDLGTNKISYAPFFNPPLLFNGVKLPWQPFKVVNWNDASRITGSSTPTEDRHGITRPTVASKISKGGIQEQELFRETDMVFAGTTSFELDDAKRVQLLVTVKNTSKPWKFSCRVIRHKDYAGSDPQVIIKRVGQSDVTLTDTGGVATKWTKLSTNISPASTDRYYIIELVSRNTATSGDYSVFFDDFSIQNGQGGQLFAFLHDYHLAFGANVKTPFDTWITNNTPPIEVAPAGFTSPLPSYFRPT